MGSHLLYELTKEGSRVRALKRGVPEIVQKIFEWYNPEGYKTQLKLIEWIAGDLSDIFSLQDALQGIDHVYHCAAMVSFVPSERDQMMRTNVDGTANLVNACLAAGVKKLCHCSSISAIGRPDAGAWVDESLIWKTSRQNTHYSISKFGAEREVWRASEEGLPVIIVNPSVIIGPGDPTRSSARLYTTVKNGLLFHTTGSTGFVDVRDVALAMKMLMEKEICNERYILNSENITYKSLFEIFARCAGVKPPPYKAGPMLSEIAWRLEKVRSILTGKSPLITKETARSGNSNYSFSNQKIKNAIPIDFFSIVDSAANTARYYEKFKI